MKIYIAHSKDIDYKEELYKPILEDEVLNKYEIILPHLIIDKKNNPREFYHTIDIMIAECTKTSTGAGIELGWVYDDNKPIYVIYRKGTKISNSLKVVTNNFYEYSTTNEMLKIIKDIINKEENLLD